jgi:hypothetical protein
MGHNRGHQLVVKRSFIAAQFFDLAFFRICRKQDPGFDEPQYLKIEEDVLES